MSVKKDPSGKRSVQVEVEVPGTPEQVWEAIATGPGVSAWFTPTKTDGRAGGTVTSNFGPGMDVTAAITAWEPPHRMAAESNGLGPNAPAFATEWTVEARSGGTCIVRVVHSLFADTDDWDNQLEGTESGWPSFFLILRLYLSKFRGQPSAAFRTTGFAPGPESQAWNALLEKLGLENPKTGEQRKTRVGAPMLSGTVEKVREGKSPIQLLVLDQPAPGAAFINSCVMGNKVLLMISFYLYGNSASTAAKENDPLWSAWMKENFPPPAKP
jgi:uncharacterized protein YndB with AHSA1/START domain